MAGFRKIIWLCIPVFIFSVGEIFAQERPGQTYSFEFRGEALSEVLDQVARSSGIDLVYDPIIVSGHYVYKRVNNQPVHQILEDLLSDFRLDYLTLSSGTIVIIRSVEEGPYFGTLSGIIVDSKTGTPLPGATVLLADASGGTHTNRTGNFSLNRLLTGTHTIIFSYVGYEPVIKTFHIGANEEVREQISLQSKPIDVTPIVVESHRQMLPFRTGPSIPNNPEWQPAGVMTSALQSLNLAHGVQHGLPMTDLSLQGGQHGEHRMLLDGVPIYNPYSFGQLFSSFSPYAIGTIDLQKAGYGAEHGSQIAGLIGLSHQIPQRGSKGLSFQADPLSVNIRGDLAFETSEESSLYMMMALRTNFWDIYKDPNLDQTLENWNILDPTITNIISELDHNASLYTPYYHNSDLTFFDYHFAGGYEFNPYNKIFGSLYLAENSVSTQLLNRRELPGNDDPFLYSGDYYDWNNAMAQLKWSRMLTPRLDLSLQTSYSANRFQHQIEVGTTMSDTFFESVNNFAVLTASSFDRSQINLPTQFEGNHIRHFIFRGDGSYSFTPRWQLEGGLQFDRVSSGVDISEYIYQQSEASQTSSLVGGYLNSSHRFGNFWNLNLGTRLTYSSFARNAFIEPRASIQFDNTDSKIGYWSARLAGGLYRQFINEYQITNSGPTSIVPAISLWSHADGSEIPKAWHVSGSILIEPDEQTAIKFEGFYKWQPVANITSYVNLGRDEDPVSSAEPPGDRFNLFGESTEITALGGGVRLNRSFANSRLNLLAGYDYSYTRVDYSTQFGRTLPAPWNEPHRTQFRAIWRAFPGFSVVSKWQGIWGRTWAYRQVYYNFLPFRDSQTEFPFSHNSPENDTLPAFHQVDLSFIYQSGLRSADLEIRLDLINLFNHTNILDKSLLPIINTGENIRYEIHNRTMPGFYPTASIMVKF
ncbi:MAG: TonB-dependent receptor [Balneolaceae bacterium]|nr:TonB-dependent receptor [Balneolaceae bacterium]